MSQSASKSEVESNGREGYEHRFVSDMSLEEMRERMDQLLESDPAEWDNGSKGEWHELSREIERRRDESRVFSIGDEAVLIGFEMTETNGAVGYMDEYNQNEYDVVVTGYNSEEDRWEVMVTEETLAELVSERRLEQEKWRDMYISERPANGGISGYVLTCGYHGVLSEEGSHRKKGVYKED